MRRCIELARLGIGHVAPNPLVGAVIVYEDKIIGEGYHKKFGENHAEVNAINSVQDPLLLKKSTIYVSLEPCAHFGKTPPCASLIVEKQFRRVVIGTQDPFSKVDGQGILQMINAGIDVTVGVLEKECQELNAHFFTYHLQKRPYILLKWAQSPEGFLDDHGSPCAISCPETQVIVHQWRHEFQSILVGRITVANDNPSLTVRAIEGVHPIRIVIDPELSLSVDHKVFNTDAETWIINKKMEKQDDHLRYIQLKEINVKTLVKKLYELAVQSVLVEGGAQTLSQFIEEGLWDEARIIHGSVQIEKGTKAPKINMEAKRIEPFFDDTIFYYSNP